MLEQYLKHRCESCGKEFTDVNIQCLRCFSKDIEIIDKHIPYTLKDFIPESDRTEPLIFYVAKPLAGQEIYIGYETKEDVEKLFKACEINVDLERYYNIEEVVEE